VEEAGIDVVDIAKTAIRDYIILLMDDYHQASNDYMMRQLAIIKRRLGAGDDVSDVLSDLKSAIR
jgi:hypothetical protein